MLSRIIYFLKYGIPLAVIACFIACMYSCTPQQKLKRLLRKYPQLIKTDTVRVAVTYTTPAVKKDTTAQLDTNTLFLSYLIDSLCNELDSAKRDTIYKVINHYIVNQPILKDTFFMPLKEGGYIKLFQQGKVLRHILFEPAYTHTIIVPVESNTVVYEDIPWKLAWYWLVIAFVCGIAIALFLLLRIKKSNTKSPDV